MHNSGTTPSVSELYFFWSGQGKIETATGNWRRGLRKLFRLAGVKDVEREAALELIDAVRSEGRRVALGADKAYDEAKFVAQLRAENVTPHVTQYTGRGGSSIDERTTRHHGYGVCLCKRRLVEEVFGWLKTVGGLRKLRFRGLDRVGWIFQLALAACNLVRMRRLVFQM